MARHGKALMIAAVAMAAVYRLRQPSFVPPPVRRAAVVAVPAVAAASAAAPAFADAIGDAAKRLSEEACPFMKEVETAQAQEKRMSQCLMQESTMGGVGPMW